ncbi:hypothetical protein GUITHDRAFT_106252 [Guillardia theta CCMP2712]|uniref:Uncharacterized protein n=1 Tax=Guillardia theta (strain CCMP2712) TaxID=905079 RepID=L1JIM5_GUITC|nr:hypothetical protein GUITHDRAFT_106252 [Guillardia theta CCMP2712]EKX48177.1 hypothetical protein GUITHDRAFT_106252 [Guillardia theta CCMP2712]|eukprot:XP_005835157.1 hypothetical protein GUITHDRAFT_106252 [Guillardia theta CCMP2712]
MLTPCLLVCLHGRCAVRHIRGGGRRKNEQPTRLEPEEKKNKEMKKERYRRYREIMMKSKQYKAEKKKSKAEYDKKREELDAEYDSIKLMLTPIMSSQTSRRVPGSVFDEIRKEMRAIAAEPPRQSQELTEEDKAFLQRMKEKDEDEPVNERLERFRATRRLRRMEERKSRREEQQAG